MARRRHRLLETSICMAWHQRKAESIANESLYEQRANQITLLY